MKVKITAHMEDGLVIEKILDNPKFWESIIKFYRELEMDGYSLDQLDDLHYTILGE